MRLRPLALCLAVPALVAQSKPVPLPAAVDAVVARTMKAFEVPGVSVAIVKDGKVVLAKGYGVRKLGDPAPVTARTLFGIASNSKVFTAAALAQLVDEGKLQWDDRVVDHLPGFQMSDAYVTREMRVRDLLCHRSGLGLGAGDLMFFPPSDLSAAEIVRRLRHIPLATSFRSAYAYDNILYTVAGELLREVGGKPWETVMRERFLEPLGMRDSLTSIRLVKPDTDVVMPHAKAEGRLVAIPHQPLDNSAPAGALVSSAEDMAKWVTALLAQGDLGGGRRLFSDAQARQLATPHTLLPVGRPQGPTKEGAPTLAAYALGLEVQDYRGTRMVWHTGGLAGMVTRVTLLPDRKLGVVVLTNAESGAAFQAITNTILDHDLGAPAKDWVAAYEELVKKSEARAKEMVAKAAAQRDATSRPSLPLPAYAGRYQDPWYGDVLLEERAGKLHIRFTHSPALEADLVHWQQDTFVAKWPDRTMDADAYVTFALGPDGKVREIRLEPVSPTTDFSYDFQDLRLTPVAKDAPAR
jgi:CubicO group peptidase (beta-lactamase class C family)